MTVLTKDRVSSSENQVLLIGFCTVSLVYFDCMNLYKSSFQLCEINNFVIILFEFFSPRTRVSLNKFLNLNIIIIIIIKGLLRNTFWHPKVNCNMLTET
jgi:hypothetical protein